MAETPQQTPVKIVELDAPFCPRLGDLAADLAQDGRIGVVVTLPGPCSASYQLRPLGGGRDWRAAPDGSTLRPVPVPVTHLTPASGEGVYDDRARKLALPVTVHHQDGGTSESFFIVTPGQAEAYLGQLGRLTAAQAPTRKTGK
jgi:hypothetical protein